jgi:hypothetical protein
MEDYIKKRVNELDTALKFGEKLEPLQLMTTVRETFSLLKLLYNIQINSIDDSFYKKELTLPRQRGSMLLKHHIYELAFVDAENCATWLSSYDVHDYSALRKLSEVPECADMHIAMMIDAKRVLADLRHEYGVIEKLMQEMPKKTILAADI